MNGNDRVEPGNVSLYPRDWADIDRIATESGIKSRSGALRLILQEWRDYTDNQPQEKQSTN